VRNAKVKQDKHGEEEHSLLTIAKRVCFENFTFLKAT